MPRDIKTEAIVLRRVNYGEADRILTLITPMGKISAMAKGVRKAKSRLAGGVEMFCLSELLLHEGKGELWTLTGAKMLRYYGGILKDFEKMNVAGMILKTVATKAEGEGAEFFELCRQGLEGLDEDAEMVKMWFLMNMLNLTEGLNLYRDVAGVKLAAGQKYEWDGMERAFLAREEGRYGADEIKLLRLMANSDLATVKRVKTDETVWGKVSEFVEMVV